MPIKQLPQSVPKKKKKCHAAKELAMIRKHNLDSFYNFVNGTFKTYNSITEVRRSDISSSQNIEEIAGIFNDYFASVFMVDFSDRVDIHKTCL